MVAHIAFENDVASIKSSSILGVGADTFVADANLLFYNAYLYMVLVPARIIELEEACYGKIGELTEILVGVIIDNVFRSSEDA